MSDDLFRVYFDPAEIGPDGYPYAWHGVNILRELVPPAIKDLVREQAGHRCVRCGHPYRTGEHRMEEVREEVDGEIIVHHESWSPCDEHCTHGAPIRAGVGNAYSHPAAVAGEIAAAGQPVEALWRILTVHHLNGVKHDCRWWNLASLCQRCHLVIQGKVFMDRPYDRPHSDWFKPYAAGFYAWKYLGLELSREETLARLDELLDLELRQEALW